MSWAAHNPEKYEEIVRNGVVIFILSRIPELGDLEETLDYLLEEMSFEPSDDAGYAIYQQLINLSTKQITTSEADYFGGLVDDAMNRDKAERERS